MIKASELTITLNENIIIKSLSFELKKNQTILVNGNNGSGKSTLLKTLAGFLPYTGELEVQGKISYLGHSLQLYSELTVNENIEIFLNHAEQQKCHELIKLFKLLENKSLNELSKGTQRKLALGITLSREHNILILDEPCSNLDQESQSILIDLIKESNATKVISSHEELLNKLGEQFIRL